MRRLAALALGLVACGQPQAQVEVRLGASHPRPEEIREIWSTRFRHARDRELLPIMRASARLEAPGLVLEATLRVDHCDDAVAEAMRLAVIDLTTARHRLAIHRVDAAAAETIAVALRAELGVDVHTPVDKPGKLVVAAPRERIPPAYFERRALIIEPNGAMPDGTPATALWALDPTPALDGQAIATASADSDDGGPAVELTFTDAGSAAMQALSEAARGGFLVFLVDDAFALAPRVMTRVSRSLRLALPSGPAASPGIDAPALARALAASNLADPPTLVTSEARCVPTP